jgi:hypothetical protein
MSTLTKITLPSSVVTELHVGDLFRANDTHGPVFGRIKHIKQRGVWREMLIDTTDKADQPPGDLQS